MAGSLPVKAKPAMPRVSPEGAEAAALEAEEFSNREAVKWNRRGNSGNPEPPTLIWRASNGQGAIWLGGLPQAADLNFMNDNNITLLASAMKQTAADSGGYRGSQGLQVAVPVSYHGRDRQDAWGAIYLVPLHGRGTPRTYLVCSSCGLRSTLGVLAGVLQH